MLHLRKRILIQKISIRIFFCICILFSGTAFSQWQWINQAGGTGNDFGYAIRVDGSGNSYVTGYFNNTATFGAVSLIAPSASMQMFIAKYNSTGTVLWARQGGGT